MHLNWDCILRIKSSDLSSFKIEYNSALLDGQRLDAKTSIWIWILGPYGLSLLGRKNSRQQISVICCWGHTFKFLKHISVIYEAIVTRIYKILGSLYDCNIPPPKKIKAFYSKAYYCFCSILQLFLVTSIEIYVSPGSNLESLSIDWLNLLHCPGFGSLNARPDSLTPSKKFKTHLVPATILFIIWADDGKSFGAAMENLGCLWWES